MSFLANDRYPVTGDRDRERSRGSRDRTTLESDYGRLTDRPEGDWGYGGGRGRGRSPGRCFPSAQFSRDASPSVFPLAYLYPTG